MECGFEIKSPLSRFPVPAPTEPHPTTNEKEAPMRRCGLPRNCLQPRMLSTDVLSPLGYIVRCRQESNGAFQRRPFLFFLSYLVKLCWGNGVAIISDQVILMRLRERHTSTVQRFPDLAKASWLAGQESLLRLNRNINPPEPPEPEGVWMLVPSAHSRVQEMKRWK